MADPRKPGTLARTHGALWYGSRSYRLSWLALPQAMAAAAVAAFFMGGGIGDLGLNGGAGGDAPLQTSGDWAAPMDVTATEDTLNKLQDKAGVEDDAAALAELEAIAKGGDPMASFKLGTLYSPYFADLFPYPARKDALRAVALFEPAAAVGFHKAYGALAEIYAQEPAPVLSLSKACQNFRAYVDAPARQAQGWSTGEISRMVNSANCFLNELRDPGVPYTAPTAEDAAKGLALLADPILASDSLAQWSRIKYLNRSGATLAERNSACPVIDSYLALTTPQSRQPGDNLLLSSQALCKLGQYQEPTPTPTKAAQDEAIAILTLPELREDVSALANLAWVYLQPWDIRDPVKACQAVEDWVTFVGTDRAQIDRQSPMTAINFADCLMGYQAGQPPRSPSPQEMQTVLALAQSAADRGLPNGDYMIGQINQFGTGGQPVNAPEAIKRYESCGAAGFDLCDYRLGTIYTYGYINQPKDLAKGIELLNRCSAAGNLECDAELGFWHRVEPSLKAPDAEVVAHLQKSAEGGKFLGAENLAYAYFEGTFGLPQDHKLSAEWLVKSMTLPGGASVRDWLATKPNALKSAKFWKAFHQELTRLGVYSGPISSELTTETVAALFKL